MGILSRFSTIMKSNINAILDKCEDPEKMIDQTLLDLRKDLAQVRKETASVMADEKNAARKVEECEHNVERYRKATENALKCGNDEDARQLLEKKQRYEASLAELRKTKDIASANADKMKQMHDKLTRDIEELEIRKDSIKAKAQAAKAQQHVNKVLAGGTKTESSISAFERMEAKADKMLDAANAEAELGSGSSTEDLANKYVSGSGASVDEELQKMKADLGLI